MAVDFSKPECQDVTNAVRFGLCDDENQQPAYIDAQDESKWIATVINDLVKEIHFTAVDNCIDVFRPNGDMDSRCDLMLRYENNLLLVELKTKRHNWKSEGLSQIEATIKALIAGKPDLYNSLKKRKAIVANSKTTSPAFQTFDVEQREYFYTQYRIRLQFDSEIVIV